ncbi:glycoside hydrolase [Coniochaeta ligniaria NRRL 30616]|uniref:mannan endo-1,4-beta-mannosidase n=1 Tax=Coniochaeta ligniaria NRRL 30616 TaxID=1408157 RepID=A0A1J7IM39_9PEZI|nr:glycoside hydrolase [Coniochaeta ligniaria NRRL 30616]
MRLCMLLTVVLYIGLGYGADGDLRSSKDANPPPPLYPLGARSGTYAKVSGRLFEIDGKIGYFSGTNAWWLGHLENDDDVDIATQQIADTGYTIVRVWGFGDTDKIKDNKTTGPGKIWYHFINATGGYINYGENGIQRLDYAVSRAENLGLKLILPLVNYWSDWGGQLVYNTVFGYDYTWYEHPQSQEVYRDYVKVIVTRYKNSTAIFAWELGNEPRCPNCDNSVITTWAANVSAYIKDIDPNHMVTLGDEGWFGSADGYTDGDPSSTAYLANYNGVDFVANLKIPTLDYGVFHLYPNLWGYPYEWGNLWIQQHDDAGAKANKPVILEEYGSPYRHNHTSVLQPWQETVLESGLAADQVWQFGPANLSVDVASFGDEFSVYYNDTDFGQVGRAHAKQMSDKAL